MSIYSRRRPKKSSQSHYGHLKLSIQEDVGALVVTIHEARGLKRRAGASLDTYVKLYMLPDPEKRTKEKTKRVKEKDPVFNQKFSFLLNDEGDCKKNLFVSVWSRERAGRSEMIGCMTFNVADLISSTGVNGWYQLLEEEKGREEHVAVPSTAMMKVASLSSLASTVSAPPTSISKNFAVTLVRSPKGYGFKVTCGSPVYISEVMEGLPAHQSDIHVWDLILEVEGIDVTKANGEMVADMIKKQRDTLQMILVRNGGPVSPLNIMKGSVSQSFFSHSMSDLSLPEHSGIGSSKRQIPSFSSSQTTNTSGIFGSPEGKYLQPGLLTQPADFQPCQIDDQAWTNSSSGLNFKERVTRSRDLLPEVPEELSGTEKPSIHVNGLSKYHTPSYKRSGVGGGSEEALNQPPSIGRLSSSQPGGLDMTTRHHHGVIDTTRKHSLGSPNEENKGLYELAMSSMRSKASGGPSYGSRYKSKALHNSFSSVEDSAYSTGHSSRSLNQLHQEEPLSSPNSLFGLRSRDKSPPLDTALQKISPTSPIYPESNRMGTDLIEEASNFIDWESLNRLEQKRQKYINSLLKCEKEFFEELKGGVDVFLNPLSNLISENSHRTIFMNLYRMYELSKHFCSHISSRAIQCLQAPINISCYVEEFADVYRSKLHLMVKIFEAYLRNSESARKEIAVCFTNPEFKRIVKEPSQLYSFVEAGTEYLPKMCRLLAGISYFTPLDHPDHQHLTEIIDTLMNLLPQSCNDLRKSWKSEKDIMENLKSAITFPSNGLESFEIVKPGRVLLHEGEAHMLEKKKKRKVWLLLFSDILLITKRTRHMLCVMEQPIQLSTVVIQDMNCAEDEFQISTEDGSISRRFKATVKQEREQWIQKLKERATGSLKRSVSKQCKEVSMKQDVLRTQLEKELKTPYKKKKKAGIGREVLEVETEDYLHPLNLAEQFESNNDERMLTQVPPQTLNPGCVHEREFVPPQASVVFPLSQPILPSKFQTLPSNKKPETRQQTRKISAVLKRRSADMSNSLSQLSQGGFGFSNLSPSFSKRIKKDNSSAKPKATRDQSTKLSRINRDRLEQWSESLHELLADPVGIRLFEEFLVKECSQENLAFWKACKDFSDPWTTPDDKLQSTAQKMYDEFISHQAPNLVNIDHTVRTEIMTSMTSKVTRKTFDQAMVSIFTLMQRDSYGRFVRQPEFLEALALSKVF